MGGHGGTASETAAPAPTSVSSAGALLLPPPQNFLGENRGYIGHLGAHWRRGLLGALGKRGLLGALGRRGHLRALGRRGHLRALGRRGHLRALGRRGHLRALGRRGHLRALARSGLWRALARSGLWRVLARSGLWGAQLRGSTTGGLAILIAGGLAIFSAGGPALAANGGGHFPTDGGITWAANGGGFGRAADNGGLVLARGRTLSRHRRIPTLHFSPVVSGRSTGRWALAPCQNSERMVASSSVVAAVSLQNSQEYSGNGRSWRARAMKWAATSIAAGTTKQETKTRKKRKINTGERERRLLRYLRSSLL